jgi:uncharacterized sulfatase
MGLNGGGDLNNPYWQTWIWDSWNSSKTYDLVQRYMHRPAEALYHTTKDPFELSNLVDQPEHQVILDQLRSELDRWMKSQGDPGIDQDTHETHQAAKRGEHRYRPPSSTFNQ